MHAISGVTRISVASTRGSSSSASRVGSPSTGTARGEVVLDEDPARCEQVDHAVVVAAAVGEERVERAALRQMVAPVALEHLGGRACERLPRTARRAPGRARR